MKIVALVFILFLCNQTFAQQLNNNDEKLPSLILLTYPNIKDAFINTSTLKNDLNNYNNPFFGISTTLNSNLNISTSRRANRNYVFSQSGQITLSKELLKVMHRFPGDGSNLLISPRGLLVP
ncbi:MAG: hypothetical protein WA839_14495 [Flavobacteriaceae bacterium]|tara:strand:+ start:4409 stop:4774 length:366 start_codon:yes stop_codon:yes gene_type:complete